MAKENNIKMEREPTVWENIFANYTLDKGLISKIYKELTMTPHQEDRQSNLQMGKGPEQILLQGRCTEGHRHMEKCSTSLAMQKILLW